MPKDIRLDHSDQASPVHHPSTKETSPKNNEQTPPPPIGTHLELVDDDEDYLVSHW